MGAVSRLRPSDTVVPMTARSSLSHKHRWRCVALTVVVHPGARMPGCVCDTCLMLWRLDHRRIGAGHRLPEPSRKWRSPWRASGSEIAFRLCPDLADTFGRHPDQCHPRPPGRRLQRHRRRSAARHPAPVLKDAPRPPSPLTQVSAYRQATTEGCSNRPSDGHVRTHHVCTVSNSHAPARSPFPVKRSVW